MAVFKDLSGRAAGSRALKVRGTVVLAVLSVVASLLYMQSQGRFADRFPLMVNVNSMSGTISPGADVKFRGLTIGTVRNVELLGAGRQSFALDLKPSQAVALNENLSARLVATNAFGASAIELIQNGPGKPLPRNATLTIAADSGSSTVTGLLERASRVIRVLDIDQLRRFYDLTSESSGTLGQTMSAFLEVARMLSDDQRGSLAHYLRIGAENSEGFAVFTDPLVSDILQIVRSGAYFGDPASQERARRSLSTLGTEAELPLIDILRKDNPTLLPIVGAVFDLLVPMAASFGTIAPAYNRVGPLLDNMLEAFPSIDGRTQLQLELIVKNLPVVANSLMLGTGGGQ